MKKLIYLSGIISANMMMFGSIFKMMHWPAANIMLGIAAACFCLLFLPAALISLYRNSPHKSLILLYAVTYVVFSLGILSIYFRILHLPISRNLLLTSLPLPFILFLPVFLYTSQKENMSRRTVMSVILGLTFIAVFSVLLTAH